MADYAALQTKWGTLTGTTDQKLTTLNATTVAQAKIATIPVTAVVNAFAYSDLATLTTNQLLILNLVTSSATTVDASVGSNVRNTIQSIFTGKTATLAALSTLINQYDGATVPWWQANGFAGPIGTADLALAGGLS